jgi:hypothetical protein
MPRPPYPVKRSRAQPSVRAPTQHLVRNPAGLRVVFPPVIHRDYTRDKIIDNGSDAADYPPPRSRNLCGTASCIRLSPLRKSEITNSLFVPMGIHSLKISTIHQHCNLPSAGWPNNRLGPRIEFFEFLLFCSTVHFSTESKIG